MQVEYKEMDDHLAHLSEDEYYSEEERKEREKEKDNKVQDKESKEVEKTSLKAEEIEQGEESDHNTDDPTGKKGKKMQINLLIKLQISL